MEKIIERHPLTPFLPSNAQLLILGSFPPQQKRWSMNFFYPNIQNDMWRILGIHFFQDKEYFVSSDKKHFLQERISQFLIQKGIALYDTATAIHRLQDNAADKFLEIIEPTNISNLLLRIPTCHTIATTGQKATDIFCEQFHIEVQPQVGYSIDFKTNGGYPLRLYRMPSSSRAYPLALEKKARIYGRMFNETLK